MKFIEMTGETLQHIVSDEELQVRDLKARGSTPRRSSG